MVSPTALVFAFRLPRPSSRFDRVNPRAPQNASPLPFPASAPCPRKGMAWVPSAWLLLSWLFWWLLYFVGGRTAVHVAFTMPCHQSRSLTVSPTFSRRAASFVEEIPKIRQPGHCRHRWLLRKWENRFLFPGRLIPPQRTRPKPLANMRLSSMTCQSTQAASILPCFFLAMPSALCRHENIHGCQRCQPHYPSKRGRTRHSCC